MTRNDSPAHARDQNEAGDSSSASTAPALSELQRSMERLIMSRHSLSEDVALRPALEQMFAGSERLSPAEQVEIYRDQFWLRHTASLLEDFPGVSFILGEKTWEEVSQRYLAVPQALTFALRDLGCGLAAHLKNEAEQGRIPGERADWAVQMAQLEWAYVEVFDAEDQPVLDAARVTEIGAESWPLATFEVSAAVRLLELDLPVADLRRAIKRGEARAEALPDRLPQMGHWVVYRRERELWDKQVSEPAFRLLEQLVAGEALVPACEAVVRRLPASQERLEEELFTWFALWGRLGWICDVRPGAPLATD